MNIESLNRLRRPGCTGFATLLTLFLGSITANAAPVSCQYGELTRSIEVVYSNPGQPVPCEVLYDKSTEGGSSTLWRAQNEAGFCEARAAEFVTKLSDMGWQCSESTLESLEPEVDTEAG